MMNTPIEARMIAYDPLFGEECAAGLAPISVAMEGLLHRLGARIAAITQDGRTWLVQQWKYSYPSDDGYVDRAGVAAFVVLANAADVRYAGDCVAYTALHRYVGFQGSVTEQGPDGRLRVWLYGTADIPGTRETVAYWRLEQ